MMIFNQSTLDSLGGKLSRSWEITKKTFAVMKHDKEILLFPVLSVLFSVILFLLFVFPVLAMLIVGKFVSSWAFFYGGIFVFYFITTFVAIFFNAGMVHIAQTRFQGGDATFKDGIKKAWERKKQIFLWAFISALVGLILSWLSSESRERNGALGIVSQIVVSILGFAWAIISLFVVPAIVIKGYGPIEALKKSAHTVKTTWGESLTKYMGLSAIRSVVNGICLVVLLLPAIFFFFYVSKTLAIVLGLLFIIILAITNIIFSAANTIFDTALFLYADTGKVPEFYAKEELEHAFVTKK